MKLWKRARGWLLLLALVTGLYFGFLYLFLAISVARLPDYGKMPPAQVFQMVLGYPPPLGITELRAEGREAQFGRSTVWLTFHFTDAALASMLKGREHPGDPVSGLAAREMILGVSRPFSRRSAERMRRLGWEEAVQIPDPRVYSLPTARQDTERNWAGLLIVDQIRHRAYVKASD